MYKLIYNIYNIGIMHLYKSKFRCKMRNKYISFPFLMEM